MCPHFVDPSSLGSGRFAIYDRGVMKTHRVSFDTRFTRFGVAADPPPGSHRRETLQFVTR